MEADYEPVLGDSVPTPPEETGWLSAAAQNRAEAFGDRGRFTNGAREPAYERGRWDGAATSLVTRLA